MTCVFNYFFKKYDYAEAFLSLVLPFFNFIFGSLVVYHGTKVILGVHPDVFNKKEFDNDLMDLAIKNDFEVQRISVFGMTDRNLIMDASIMFSKNNTSNKKMVIENIKGMGRSYGLGLRFLNVISGDFKHIEDYTVDDS